jgi:hypothetical protein
VSDTFHEAVTFRIFEDDGAYWVETYWAGVAEDGVIRPATPESCANLVDLIREKLLEGPPSRSEEASPD